MSARHDFTIETDPDQLERIAAVVEEIGEQESWSPGLVFRINLALEELGLNIIHYGHDDGRHEIQFSVTSDDETITIEISDDGRPFDPLNDAPVPNVSAALEDRPVGGLGVHLVRTMMDEMTYRRASGRNHITLVTRNTE